MTPDFSPEPTGLPMVPVTLAAVGEAMLRVAGQVADGVRLHPLCSRRYLEEVCLPQIADRHAARRPRRARTSTCTAAGSSSPDRTTRRWPPAWRPCARRIGFYGSTRTYLPILALHGLRGARAEAAPDVGGGTLGRDGGRGARRRRAHLRRLRHLREIAGAIEQRFGGVADSIDLDFPADAPAGLRREVLADIRRIPHRFAGFRPDW